MTLFGPDISKWQDGIAPANLGFQFLIARASIGRTVDYLYDDALAFARGRKAPFAGYHFPYEVSSHPAKEQAATWDQANGGDKQVRCMIDWESDGSQAATVDDAVAVAQAIEALGYAVTLLYTGSWYWQQQGSPDMSRLNQLGIGLIVAKYGGNPVGTAADCYAAQGGDSGAGWKPLGGVVPTFWQFGSQVHIGTKGSSKMYGDCNAFKGVAADLGKWFTTWGGAPVPPDPTPDPDPDWWRDTLGALPDLRQGATGIFVKRMQHLLARAGFMNQANTANYDGVFGSGTLGALNRFKAAVGTAQNGVCDDQCWADLMGAADGIPTLNQGATGANVARMQHLLAADGFMNEANVANYDGVFGSGTAGALSRFKGSVGLLGASCDPQTWQSLLTGKHW